MLVKINGTQTELQRGTTLEGLLMSLEIKTEGVAVELNREVVPKRLHASTQMKDNDAVEIIRMTGGG